MKAGITLAVALIEALQKVSARKWSFLGLFALAFLASVAALAALDLLPEAPTAAADTAAIETATTTEALPAVAELPLRVEIPAIKKSVTVENPDSTEIAVLDSALHRGAVRYPTSAKLGEEGNVVLFGHSSYLPVVANQAYKTFNDIQKLHAGDAINVYGADTVYVYHVRSVEKESAQDGAIELASQGAVLTLATCNSFGEKSDRFVVTADFVESHPAP